MKEAKSLEWQNLYQKATSEREPERLPERIARAEGAIYSRIRQTPKQKMDDTERQAIDDALRALGDLKVQHLPGWKY
jgi:hypothetical protein